MIKHAAHSFLLVTVLAWGFFPAGCDRPVGSDVASKRPQNQPGVSNNVTAVATGLTAAAGAQEKVLAGDLDVIQRNGRLRILVQPFDKSYLPRDGYPLDHERELAAEFAGTLNLKSELVYVDAFEDLIPALLKGRGDLIAANLTITDARSKQIAFTVPVDRAHEQVVARVSEKNVRQLSDLQGRTLAVQEKTSFWERAQRLQRQFPGIRVKTLSGRLGDDALLDEVASGRSELTIEDSNMLDIALKYRSDIKAVLTFPEESVMAWGLRRDNPKLRAALDAFLTGRALLSHRNAKPANDWPEIKKRKTIRFLTRNNAACYFLWRGELFGFEYECARRFARAQGLNLEMVVAPSHEDLLRMLKEGKGDVVAAFLSPTDERLAQGAAFSSAYLYASEDVVMRANDPKTLKRIEDLAGRTVVVRRSSSYWSTLQKLKTGGVRLKIQAAPETMETSEIIDELAEGRYDLTVADSHILNTELAWRDDIKRAFPLTEPKPHCWVVRAGDKKLLAVVNDFWRREYREVFYNVTFNKYFKNIRNIRSYVYDESRIKLDGSGMISPYDNLVKRYAGIYGFDWCLIVSQMFQESRFNPKARSSVGAKGLLQVMPRTAGEVGLGQRLEDPETGIHAGVKYLDWVRKNIYPEPSPEDQVWFALAAYNAGVGHVSDASRLAEQLKLQPNRWFDNVEKAIKLLSKSRYANQSRYGYVSGEETATYVRQIRDRYGAYLHLVLNKGKPGNSR